MSTECHGYELISCLSAATKDASRYCSHGHRDKLGAELESRVRRDIPSPHFPYGRVWRWWYHIRILYGTSPWWYHVRNDIAWGGGTNPPFCRAERRSVTEVYGTTPESHRIMNLKALLPSVWSNTCLKVTSLPVWWLCHCLLLLKTWKSSLRRFIYRVPDRTIISWELCHNIVQWWNYWFLKN